MANPGGIFAVRLAGAIAGIPASVGWGCAVAVRGGSVVGERCVHGVRPSAVLRPVYGGGVVWVTASNGAKAIPKEVRDGRHG